MSVNWDWKDKKGEILWKRKEVYNPSAKVESFTWNIYQANCLACFLYEYKDKLSNTDMYTFMSFFSDRHHMNKLLGLEKNYKGKKEDWFKNIFWDYEIEYVKLDTSYPYWEQISKAFTKAGYNVQLYKGGER